MSIIRSSYSSEKLRIRYDTVITQGKTNNPPENKKNPDFSVSSSIVVR